MFPHHGRAVEKYWREIFRERDAVRLPTTHLSQSRTTACVHNGAR